MKYIRARACTCVPSYFFLLRSQKIEVIYLLFGACVYQALYLFNITTVQTYLDIFRHIPIYLTKIAKQLFEKIFGVSILVARCVLVVFKEF